MFAMLPNDNSNDIVFRKGDTIIDYVGEILNVDAVNARYGEDNTAPYTIQVGKDAFIDCACKRGVGSTTNCNKGHHNATFSTNQRNQTAKLVATKNIRNGDEVFVSYGSDYRFEENVSHTTKPIRNK